MNKPPVGRQFDFWGNEAPSEPQAAPEPQRGALAGRTKSLKRAIGDSDSMRMRDDAIGVMHHSSQLPLGSKDEKTGLPKSGAISTSHIPGMAPMGSGKETPGWAKFHTLGLAPRLQGTLAEIPIIHPHDHNVVRATQPTVSSRRIGQLIADPSTGVNPRLPATSPSNLPVVYQHSEKHLPNVTDGHHRISTALVRNTTEGQQMEMFTPVRKFTPEHEGRTRDAEMRMYTAYGNAQEKRMKRPPSKNVKPSGAIDSRPQRGVTSMLNRFGNERFK